MEQSHTRKIPFNFYRDKKKNLIFVVTLAFLLYGCRPIPSNKTWVATISISTISTNSFLSGTPCSAPCFFDLIPGTTKKDEVVDHLRKYDFLSSCVEKQIDDSISSVLICAPSVDFWFKEDKLTKIIIEPTTTITIEQVIKKYGDPTDVNYSLGGTNDVTLVKLVYYKNSRFVLHLSDPTSSEQQNNSINPQSKILWVDYVDDETMKNFDNECTFPWNGYGNYDMKSGC